MAHLDPTPFLEAIDKLKAPPADIVAHIESLENALNRTKKEGKALKSIQYTFDRPDLEITLWKFNEWDYSNPKIVLPSRARGLFTVKDPRYGPRIVARGYDKFFNINEVSPTNLENLKNKSYGPYEITLKTNGCIIFILGLSDGTLLVCSKHLTGPLTNLRNHAEQGKKWLEKQLKGAGIDPKDLALFLARLNLTAVAEYCDDDFEEHVLPYTGKDAGLYLHGLNLNHPDFYSLPMELVNKFSELFGFQKTEYFVEENIESALQFFEEASKTGMYHGVEIEGFVIRCHNDLGRFFWKYKFEEPYLMYREWREATKKLLKLGSLDDAAFNLYNAITRDYLQFANDIIQKRPIVGACYKVGYGIIELRKLYLKLLGKEGYELVRSNSDTQKTIQVDEILALKTVLADKDIWKDLEGVIQKFNNLSLEPEEPETKEDVHSIYKYVLVPVATIGCGKTTVSRTLVELCGWGHVQNDDLLKYPRFNQRLERTCLQYLMGDKDCLDPKNINAVIEKQMKERKKFPNDNPYSNVKEENVRRNGDKPLDRCNVIIADRNFHMKRERKEFFAGMDDLKKDYLTNDGEYIEIGGKKVRVKYVYRFVCLNFIPNIDGGVNNSKLQELTKRRVLARGDNHQSIKADSQGQQKAEMIMNGFVKRFQPVDRLSQPDSRFHHTIQLYVDEENSSKNNVLRILDLLKLKYPDLFEDGKVFTENEINTAFEKALTYVPTITKVVKSGLSGKEKQKKKDETKKPGLKLMYFGVLVENKDFFLEKVRELIVENEEQLSLLEIGKFYEKLQSSNRVQRQFHVTLSHINEQKKDYFEYVNSFFQNSEWKDGERHKKCPDVRFTVVLDKLVWDNKALAVSVQLVETTDKKFDIQKSILHITLGTADSSIKPFYANQMIAKELPNGLKEGIKPDYVVLKWKDEVVLKDVPLTAFRY